MCIRDSNKTDLQPEIQPEILEEKTGHPVIPISAKEEKGITELEEQIKDMFFGGCLLYTSLPFFQVWQKPSPC